MVPLLFLIVKILRSILLSRFLSYSFFCFANAEVTRLSPSRYSKASTSACV